MTTRREFLRTATVLGGLGLAGGGIAATSEAAATGTKRTWKPLKFGLIADIHKNHCPYVDERLEVFMKRAEAEKPDFILSLGDFCYSLEENEPFVKRFSGSGIPAYHVLGNHEMDKNTKNEAVSFLGMSAPFYSVDVAGYHLVVLDPNWIFKDGKFLDYDNRNYYKFGSNVSFVTDDQCDWLKADLEKTKLPTMLFSHQSLMHDNSGIPNRAFVKEILKQANERSVRSGLGNKVLACFNGHHHRDAYRTMDGIHYFSINSASYFHVGKVMPHRFSDPEVYKKFRSLDKSIPYKDPLFSFVTIDPSGTLSLKGTKSEWLGPPLQQDLPESVAYSRGEATPQIRDRKVTLS